MTNCFTDLSHPLYGFNRQDKNSQIIVSVTEDINPCVRWKTKNYSRIATGTFVEFDRRAVPADVLNCNSDRCSNSGTLFVDTSATNGVAKVTYELRSPSNRYQLGFNFIYVNVPQAGMYELKTIISDFNDKAQENAYVYTQRFNAGVPGDYLRTIDLVDTSIMTQIGEGWQVSDRGVVVSYELTYVDQDSTPLVLTQFGFSTGQFVNEREELRKFANVILSCLTSFTHNVSTPATDARCFGREYDPDQIEITKDITATTTSCNDYWLNPLQSVSKVLSSGVPTTAQFRVQDVVYEGKTYGMFFIPDLFYGDCNSITISSDGCECNYLSKLPVTVGTNLEDDEFILIDREGTEEKALLVQGRSEEGIPQTTIEEILEQGTVLVHESYIGQELLVTYNAEREVELIVANDKRLNKTRFRVIQEVVDTRGVKSYYVFNNVLITENSREYVTEGEITLSLSFTVSRDKDGNFYEIRRSTDDIS